MNKYIKLQGNDFYHEIDFENMRLYNYRGGWQNINENSDEWMYGHVVEAEDWTDLFKQVGYNPLLCDIYESDIWIAPNGTPYDGKGHAVAAMRICELLYRKDLEWNAESFLEDNGWIKASRFFWNLHLQDKYTWEMTQAQADTLFDWCKAQRIYYPNDIIVIRDSMTVFEQIKTSLMQAIEIEKEKKQ